MLCVDCTMDKQEMEHMMVHKNVQTRIHPPYKREIFCNPDNLYFNVHKKLNKNSAVGD